MGGSGKIGFTPLNNTFSWMLGGNKQDYTALWSAIISTRQRAKADEMKKTYGIFIAACK
jgi:hypothetical protein